MNNKYEYRLEKLSYGRSNRLSRYLGSASVLQLTVEKKLRYDNEVMKGMLSTYLCLFGRTFMPIHAKDGKAIFVQCRVKPMRAEVVNYPRLTKTELLDWYNPLKEGDKQASDPLSDECNSIYDFICSLFQNGLPAGSWFILHLFLL